MSDEWKKVEKSNSTTWNYKEKPTLVGVYKGVEYHVGPNDSTLFKFACDEGEVAVWGMTALNDKLLGIPVGYEVKIDYKGLKASKKAGRHYHNFEVQYRELFTEGGSNEA